MARGKPTEADRAVLAYLREQRYTLRAPTLEYWRGQGALPPRRAPGLGRGRGRGSEDPSEVKCLALGICRFLDKTNGIPDRPDLPRRRRVAESSVWLWYDGWPVPFPMYRDGLCAAVVAFEAELVDRRRMVSQEVGAPDYDATLAVAEEALADPRGREMLRRQVRAFRRHRPAVDRLATELAESSVVQLLTAVQDQPDYEPGLIAGVIEAPLGGAYPGGQVMEAADEARFVAQAPAQVVLRTLAERSPEDWDEIRAVLRAINDALTKLAEQADDPVIRAVAQEIPRVQAPAGLAYAASYVALNLEDLRQ